MRTTIDLPDDLHRAASAIACERHESLSATVTDLIRRGLAAPQGVIAERRGGFPIIRVGRPVIAEDVRALDDDG